jgi:site-specific recombinase XerD
MVSDLIVHERMLLGAIDSFLSHTVHVRPFLAKRYRHALEEMAAQWIDSGGVNEIEAPTPEWVARYVSQARDRAGVKRAIRDFYAWAVREGLTDRSPLAL